MPDTVTDLLKFTKPQVGASANTWGNKWNVNLDGIDNAYQDMSGRLTGGSGAAYTYIPLLQGSPLFGEDGNIELKTGLSVRVRIHDDNTEVTPTFKYGSLDAKPIKKNRGGNYVNLEIGELTTNYLAEFLYHTGIPGFSSGIWIFLNPASITDDTGHTNQLANHRALAVRYLNANTVEVRADAVVLRRSDGRKKLFQPTNGILETADITTSGANGLISAGPEAPGWYSIYLIGKDDGSIAGALSGANGGPGPAGGNWPPSIAGLPSGYSYSGFVGVVRNNATNDFVDFWQVGNIVTVLDTTPINVPHTNANFDDILLGSFCPAEALMVRLGVNVTHVIGGGGFLEVRIAPSKADATTSRHGEVRLKAFQDWEMQVDVVMSEMQKVYVRSPNFSEIASLQLFVNGYYL